MLAIAFVIIIASCLVLPITQINATEKIGWKVFNEKNGHFTIKYPSNWIPYRYVEGSLAPVNIYFSYSGGDSSFAQLLLFGEESIYSNASDLVDSNYVYLQTEQDYEVLQPTQCGKYTIKNITACNAIVTYRDVELEGKPKLKELIVGTLDDQGMEYVITYYVTTDLYDHYLPVAEEMIRSFNITSSSSSEQAIPTETSNSTDLPPI
ncbi:MAG TPA: hypothetical protein VJ772_02645 [Nitrososphaeraceae archaeon]|nr:hypothetical protein [Nitrososphaeraceae archaeon]